MLTIASPSLNKLVRLLLLAVLLAGMALSADVALAGLNGDGVLDAVFANANQINLRCLGDGAGGFSSCADVSADTNNSQDVALGDLNGDGLLDAVFANGNHTSRRCLGDGAGGFSSCANVSAGIQTYGVALGDLNGDGVLDAVFANDNQFNRRCLGVGTGDFNCANVSADFKRSTDVALGDLDGDGNLDAVFSNAINQTDRRCLGDGAGGFNCADVSADTKESRDVALGDLDGDGVLDAVFANSDAAQSNQRCLGDGAGGFNCADVSADVKDSRGGVALGDLDGDGVLDAVFANVDQTNRRCLGDGVGDFSSCADLSVDTNDSTGVALTEPPSATSSSSSTSSASSSQTFQRGIYRISIDNFGGSFSFGRVMIRVPVGLIPSGYTDCRLVITLEADSNIGFGFSTGDPVYEIQLECNPESLRNLTKDITVCLRPKDDLVSNKQLFHRHNNQVSFSALLSTSGSAGYVCGQTNQFSLFTIDALTLPATGFTPGRVTTLPQQSEKMAYSSTDLILVIPKLGVELPIVGVPLSPGGWDTTWLDRRAGYLHTTAFPTFPGNTVLTSHVWVANNNPGPFARLKELQYGDQFSIYAWGLEYTYEVRSSRLVNSLNLSVLGHREYDWVTLITCENYHEASDSYLYRRAVQAVLVSVD